MLATVSHMFCRTFFLKDLHIYTERKKSAKGNGIILGSGGNGRILDVFSAGLKVEGKRQWIYLFKNRKWTDAFVPQHFGRFLHRRNQVERQLYL